MTRREGHSPMTHLDTKRVTVQLPTRVTPQLPTPPVENPVGRTKRVTPQCQEGHSPVTPTRKNTRRDRSPRERWNYSLGATADESQTGIRR